jgi:hypothetical protein
VLREAYRVDPTTRGQALSVIPTGHGGGFEGSIRGHLLELADPADRRLAGIREVDNLIRVKPSGDATAAKLERRVREALADVAEPMPAPFA